MYCLKVKFPTEHRVGVVKGDQVLAHKCYQAILASKENHMWMIKEKSSEAVEALETIELAEGESTKVTNVGLSLDPLMKEEIVKFLRKLRCFCLEP